MSFVPTKVFFTKGVGRSKDKLQAFELALRAAGIEKCNLVTVSSILPPGAKMLSKNEGLKYLKAGQITFVVMARIEDNEPNRLMAASVGAAIPANPDQYGYLSEHHGFGQTEEHSGDYAEDLAASMLASTLGIEFDSEKAWDEKKQYFKMSSQIVKTTNITQSAICDKNGKWTSVISVAVLLP
ncbi:arginine decarboxylase, pyruvoyl-dependent [Candidatus Micrarchaeota archaeon]|nr:arginine decarboxylase, pyruvoyl-dependent [Candidatus Micrarchaeota archaeon]MBU1165472.1 arginine decarboxylase, pyruvoyl-dependent [Candidatus Micrarchaeota archaeon]MBU1887453.1 arginine decarboxylase, pyruvoyl-dependent [Candidatus Micrarchaeota archaeon]